MVVILDAGVYPLLAMADGGAFVSFTTNMGAPTALDRGSGATLPIGARVRRGSWGPAPTYP
eukprot:4260097-Pyramimonas_sp.AAC.1